MTTQDRRLALAVIVIVGVLIGLGALAVAADEALR